MKRKRKNTRARSLAPAPVGRGVVMGTGAGARHVREWSGKIRALRVRACGFLLLF
jgi:hypothetical protein